MAKLWITSFQEKMRQKLGGSAKTTALIGKYEHAFTSSYQETYSPAIAYEDIVKIEQLTSANPLLIDFYQAENQTQASLHVRLFQWENPIALSDVLPMLENMNLRTFNEQLYPVTLKQGTVWISDFTVAYYSSSSINIPLLRPLFQDAFTQIYFGLCENDGFNKLILGANLTWREVNILRAYAKYLHQVGFRFSQAYLEKTFIQHTSIIKNLIDLFLTRHHPNQKKPYQNKILKLEKEIHTALEAVTNLDEDRILRRMWALIKATLRTNYFQTLANNNPKSYLSLKFASAQIPDLPLPHPLYEIFIYSPRFEGIHLRSEKVARGGIRWSERREDFRTEILGLMKAQKVKNSVIVPSGAKGGFVLKKPPVDGAPEHLQKEVVECYQLFIRGLLDLTDNLKENTVIRPSKVVCYDDDDPYLVVAADKGTATFSDLANAVAKEYQFWLGDAFASGGSAGYDHKKMGITARGAWEAVRRHFHELNINIDIQEFTVVGIGDMSGDVFGNGMIYSPRIKLIAAFDHRHIFIDPTPDPNVSYQERLRLFKLPRSSWNDYNTKLISAGGGIFPRSSKSIIVSEQMKKCLAIQVNSLTPNELIQAILKAPVDLLFNGGIGTYVKASTESHADVGDKTTEFCRINANELRCRTVGEGGNLGFTQLARVEYALQGGLINTDFIDNSAGVDCSDHEVNIKILLNKQVEKNKLSTKKRNQLLLKMTDDIAEHVLQDNFNQARVMSVSASRGAHYIGLHRDYIHELEVNEGLNRAVEFLPDDKKIVERKNAGQGLTRPELAVLLAYTKIYLKKEILKSDLPEDKFFSQLIEGAFPQVLRKSFAAEMHKHRLHREIVATQLSNAIANEMGVTFVYRMQSETGASIADVIRAHTLASRVFSTLQLEELIESLNFKISIHLQYELLHHVRHLVNLATRWFLRSSYLKKDIQETIQHFSSRVMQLEKIIPKLMVGTTKVYLNSLIEQFVQAGVAKEFASRIAISRALYISLSVIEIATQHHFDLIKTAEVYFEVGEKFNLVWFRDQISQDSREGHWNNLARLVLRDELNILQRLLTVIIMDTGKGKLQTKKWVGQWIENHPQTMERWNTFLSKVQADHGGMDYTLFFIALRELAEWVRA